MLGQRQIRLTGIEPALGCDAGPTLNRNLVGSPTTDLFKTYDLHSYIENKEVIPLSIAINKITLFENNKWNTSMQLKHKLRRTNICQLRCGVLPLAIETSRYTNTPVDQRLCHLCNVNHIEDESHLYKYIKQ